METHDFCSRGLRSITKKMYLNMWVFFGRGVLKRWLIERLILLQEYKPEPELFRLRQTCYFWAYPGGYPPLIQPWVQHPLERTSSARPHG